jgi:hypothetical protein
MTFQNCSVFVTLSRIGKYLNIKKKELLE